MSRFNPDRNLSLQAQIDAVKAEIEKAKLAKLQATEGASPAVIDQESMRYEDIKVHPEDREIFRAKLEADFENQRLRDEYNKREWYLSMVGFAP